MRAQAPASRAAGSAALGVTCGALVAGTAAAGSPGLVAVAVVLGLVAVLLLSRPVLATVLVVALLDLNVAVVLVVVHGLPPLTALAPFAVLALPLAHHLLQRSEPLVWGAPTSWCVAFGASAMASQAAAPPRPDDLAALLVVLSEGVLLFVLLTNAVRSWESVRWCGAALAASAAALGGLAVLQSATGATWRDFAGFAQTGGGYLPSSLDWTAYADGVDPEAHVRAAGPIGEPNFFAMTLVACVPWAVLLARTSGSAARRAAWWLALLAVAGGVVVTYSRGALVAVAATGLVLASLRVVRARHLLLAGALAVVAVSVVPSYGERVGEVVSAVRVVASGDAGGQDDPAARGRSSEVVAALRVFADHPLLGVGPGRFPAYYQAYEDGSSGGVHSGAGERQAHNLVAGLAAEQGVLGLVAFGGLVVAVLRPLLRARREPGLVGATALASASSLLLVLACGMFLHLAYVRYVFLHLALGAAVARLAASAWERGAARGGGSSGGSAGGSTGASTGAVDGAAAGPGLAGWR